MSVLPSTKTYWRSLAWLCPSAFCDLINTFPELTYLLRACTCAKCLFVNTLHITHPASCSERSLLALILRRIGTILSCAIIGIMPNICPIIFTPKKPTQSPAQMLANNVVVLPASLLRRWNTRWYNQRSSFIQGNNGNYWVRSPWNSSLPLNSIRFSSSNGALVKVKVSASSAKLCWEYFQSWRLI